MKINIPKVIVGVDMSEYAPELAGQCLHVWVNPPLDVLGAHLTLAAQFQQTPVSVETGNLHDPLLAWYVDLWSQGPEPTHWTMEEAQEIQQQDPAFLSWMIGATWEARKAHMDRKKKV